MIAYNFRQMDDGKPTGYIGMVCGQNKRDLFWLIDEYLDPYSVQIKTAHRGGHCRFFDIDDLESSKHETSEYEPPIDDDGWRTPNWDNI